MAWEKGQGSGSARYTRTGRRKVKARGDDAKRIVLDAIRGGYTIEQAVEVVGKSKEAYYYYLKSDPAFKREVDVIRGRLSPDEGLAGRKVVPDFPEFCEEYLGMRLFPHQLQWFDVLEGREPRDLHASQTYVRADPNLVVVNTPPGHAKSMTLTIAYVTWKIVKDPSFRVVIVSQAATLAKQFLLAIKDRLTGHRFSKMQKDFGPPGGWDADSASWKQDLIYLSSAVRTDGEKDPNVQAIGIGAQIYGFRSDLIILDDVVVNANAGEYEKQLHWLQTEVMSRDSGGDLQIIVIGTRMAPRDLYGELLNPDRYHGDEVSPWTYMSQPAVLEYKDDPKDWVTLWPKSDSPATRRAEPDEDGLYDKWTGPVLAKRRSQLTPSQWARVYQQEQVAEDTVFKLEDIRACTKGWSMGRIPDDPNGAVGIPGGMQGFRVVAGLDPASVGHTAAVVVGFNPSDNKRYVLHVHNQPAMTPDQMRSLIRDLTTMYGINEWRIERNAFQRFLTLDTEVRSFLASHGCVLTEHTTGRNKNDPGFGVMAMEGLFTSRLIQLPRIQSEGMKALVEQLTAWSANAPKTQKDDIVMALWFAELRCLELVQTANHSNAFNDAAKQFYTRADMRSRKIVNSLDSEFAIAGKTDWGG